MKECTSCSYIRSNMHLKSLILLSALFTLAYAQDEEPPPELPTSPKDILKGAFKKGKVKKCLKAQEGAWYRVTKRLSFGKAMKQCREKWPAKGELLGEPTPEAIAALFVDPMAFPKGVPDKIWTNAGPCSDNSEAFCWSKGEGEAIGADNLVVSKSKKCLSVNIKDAANIKYKREDCSKGKVRAICSFDSTGAGPVAVVLLAMDMLMQPMAGVSVDVVDEAGTATTIGPTNDEGFFIDPEALDCEDEVMVNPESVSGMCNVGVKDDRFKTDHRVAVIALKGDACDQ